MPQKAKRNRRSTSRGPAVRAGEQMPPDAVDVALLAALQTDGRATVQALAAHVGLGSATTSVRLQSLRSKGLLKGIHGRVNYPALGYMLCAFVLLTVENPTDRQIDERILAIPEVQELAWITGDHDILLKVWAEDTKHLEAIVVRIDEIGARSKTLITLGEPQVKPGIDFEASSTTLD